MTIPESYNGKPLLFTWTYCATDGAPFGVVGRYQDKDGKKDIVPFFKRNDSGFTAGIELNPRPLYGLDKLAAHPKNKAVFIVEGEKCAAALQGLGLCALTSLGGAQSAHLSDWTPLNDFKTVYLMPDNDEPGETYAKTVYTALTALNQPPDSKLLRLPNLSEGGDVVDWLQSFISEWNGYKPIAENYHAEIKERLKTQLQNAETIPENWHFDTLAVLAGATPSDIETKIPPVLPLTDELLPEAFRQWLADVSHRLQTPPDFAAISSLVIAGSLIGAACSIRPKQFDDWEVIPNLWGACIAPPSVSLKTPSMKEPMQLLERLQAEYGKLYEQEKKAAEFDQMANKAMLDDVKSKVARTAKGIGKDGIVSPDDMAKHKADYLELSEQQANELTRRMFKTNETSIQSMTVLQNENERGLLVFRDELMGLFVKWDREDGQDERAYFLEGWNGNGSYTDCKIVRGVTDAKNICISLLGGIQPDKLKRYLYQAMKGNNDGLIQRLQLAVYPDEPQSWQLIDTIPNKAEKERVFNIMQALAVLDFIEYGAIKGEYDQRPHFHFTNEAQQVFNDWLTELQTIKIKQEDNPLMIEHLGKYRSLMPSLALIFHCIDIADNKARGNVSAKAALLAADWCKYLESHARRIYAMAESPEHEAAVRLAAKIKAKALPSPFTCKVVYDKGWHGLKEKQEVEAACNILIDENWLMMQRKPKPLTGRPPASEYFINPVFL